MPKGKKPAWFKMYAHNCSLMLALPDEVVGKSMKAAMLYFTTGIEQELNMRDVPIYAALKPFIDDAISQYQQNVENGKKSASKRKARKDGQGGLTPLKQKDKDEDKDEDEDEDKKEDEYEEIKDKEKERERIIKSSSHCPAVFIPPNVTQVEAYCAEKGYTLDPQMFVDYYTSIGWMVGKNPMKNWKAALRNWNVKESIFSQQ